MLSSDEALASVRADDEDSQSVELAALIHRLNNQLGAGLAHAELIEFKAVQETERTRAGQVIRALLEAMITTQEIRAQLADVVPSQV